MKGNVEIEKRVMKIGSCLGISLSPQNKDIEIYLQKLQSGERPIITHS